MKPPRGSASGELAHGQAEIEGAAMNTQALVDVGVAAQVSASHPPGFIGMSKTAFRKLGAKPLQPLASLSSKAPAIRIHRRLGRRILFPVSTAAIRFRKRWPPEFGQLR